MKGFFLFVALASTALLMFVAGPQIFVSLGLMALVAWMLVTYYIAYVLMLVLAGAWHLLQLFITVI